MTKQKGNRLCKAIVPYNHPKSRIAELELVTVREYNDYEGGTYFEEVKTAAEFLEKEGNAYDEPFYHIYARFHKHDPRPGRFLAEFFDLDQALNFLLDLTGEEPKVISY
jgi:hypothetical protein